MKNHFKSKRTQFFLIVALVAFIVGIGFGLLLPKQAPIHISLPARTSVITPASIGISYGDTLPGDSPSVLSQTLDDAVALGVTTIHLDLAWSDIQPNSASTYNWTNFDRVVIAAQSRNLTLLPTLAYTPAWARLTGCTTPMCAPANPNAFALFAATASKRYAPMGIHTWEIWNAPNIVADWQPTPNATQYVQLLSATSKAIKAADPQSFIVSGGLAPSDSSNGNIAPLVFFGQFANLGGIKLVDAIGAQPYSYPVPPAYNASWNAWQQMAGPTLSIESMLVARGDASKKIWLTDYGAPTNGPGAGATSSNYNIGLNPDHVDEALQAQMANDAVLLARSLSYIGAFYWYSYKDLGTATTDNKNFFGLRRFDGTAKPAWQSLHNAILTTNARPEAAGQTVTIKPQLSNAVILNPGKGWVLYGMPSDHLGGSLAYGSVGYIRYDWSDIEPTEGQYNWSVIDAALNAWKAVGKQFAFGVMNADSSNSNNPYVTPAWVFADGAASIQSNSFDEISGVTSIQHIPVWNDPIFLQKVQTFLNALAQRYDSNPAIAYIDVRSYGNWGEQHVYGIAPSIAVAPSVVQQYIQMYKNAFKHTQIIVPWGASTYNSVYDWAVNNGVGMRRDGMMVDSTGSELARANGKTPSVFEFYASYQWLLQNGYWSDSKLVSEVSIGSPSYIGMGQWSNDADLMLKAQPALVSTLANKMGYQFVLTSATLPTAITNNQATTVSLSWSNQGVAYLYKTCHVAIALLDSSNHVVQQEWVTNSNPNAWAPGKVTLETTSLTFTNLGTGPYKLAVGLFLNTTDANPTYQIGNQGKTANGWYVLTSNIT